MTKFLAFGEVMFRLSPPDRQLLLQTPRLDVWTAGAEANVASALAMLGHNAALATVLPSNTLGDAAERSLRALGVDCRHISRLPGRMGLYFVTPGAGLRPTEVVYDRAHSAFAEAPAGHWEWDALLDGVDQLHLSGITPALGPVPGRAALAAVEAASARGIRISFDGNYRARLWESWDSDPRTILKELVAHAHILFGNHRDIALMLDRDFPGDGEARRHASAAAAFEAFPKLEIIASTARHVVSSDLHRLSARIDTPNGHAQTDEIELSGIVDRIGAGDAFASGVIDALRHGRSIEDAAANGLALTSLKHSLPGDASLFTRADLEAFTPLGADVRR
ncbi:sugar kinase [Stakelama pacifica]|uniref:2-dehydro-3-deoxygluconokinase n=1 Tax=Stakelama pacifica TaxID=517720 RepID=A0A4R6G0C7_9SPHN|nr:sugar kinase [Stakelama pacifica]TDN86905.1 2-dehydro-3-deoxygluconokinase [Stakelama pacifica]GGO91025.1 2-keto-3-deoxygluconate kinase [Stakelama pacifica]